MKRMIQGAVIVAGSLALAGGALLAGGAPAGATVTNEAYGASASGPVTLAPVALATTGSTPAVVPEVNVPGLLLTGMVMDRADDTSAWATISQSMVLTTSTYTRVQASRLRSWCSVIGDTVYSGTDIDGGEVIRLGQSQFTIALPAKPAPNTEITLPDSAGTLTLNKQSTTAGVTTTEAIYASLSDDQTVTLGVSECAVPV